MSENANVVSVPERDPHRVTYVRAGDLVIDRRQQRDIDMNRVTAIAKAWDWRLAEVPIVGRLTDTPDRLTVIGHQHTVMAAIAAFDQNVMLAVRDIGEVSPEHAAYLGLTQNISPARPATVSRWESKVKMGDEGTVRINDLLNSLGYSVGRDLSQDTLSCAPALTAIINGTRTLDIASWVIESTLVTLAMAYPDGTEDAKRRFHKDLVRSVAQVFLKNPSISREALASKALHRSSESLISMAAPRAGRPGWQVLGEEIVGAYNVRLQQQNRASWTV